MFQDIIRNSSIILQAYPQSIFLSEAYHCNRTDIILVSSAVFQFDSPSYLIQHVDSLMRPPWCQHLHHGCHYESCFTLSGFKTTGSLFKSHLFHVVLEKNLFPLDATFHLPWICRSLLLVHVRSWCDTKNKSLDPKSIGSVAASEEPINRLMTSSSRGTKWFLMDDTGLIQQDSWRTGKGFTQQANQTV